MQYQRKAFPIYMYHKTNYKKSSLYIPTEVWMTV